MQPSINRGDREKRSQKNEQEMETATRQTIKEAIKEKAQHEHHKSAISAELKIKLWTARRTESPALEKTSISAKWWRSQRAASGACRPSPGTREQYPGEGEQTAEGGTQQTHLTGESCPQGTSADKTHRISCDNLMSAEDCVETCPVKKKQNT